MKRILGIFISVVAGIILLPIAIVVGLVSGVAQFYCAYCKTIKERTNL